MKKFTTFETQLGESALDLTDKAKLSLYKKSQNSGYSIDILEEVYRRGYRCWNESFGGNAEQFAFDRVNSFIAGGFATQLDTDLLSEEDAEKHSKNPDDPASRFMGSDELVDIYKKETPGQTIKRVIKEAGAYIPPPTYDVTAGKPTSSYSRTASQSSQLNQSGNQFRNTSTTNPTSRSVRSGTGSARASIGGQSGYSSASQQMKPTSMSTRTPTSFSASRSVPTPDSRLSSSGGGSMKPTNVTSKAPTFSQGGGTTKMTDKLTDMTRKMDKGFVPQNQIGQSIAKGFGKTATELASKLGKVAGPVGVAAEVMRSTPAGEKQTEFQRQDQLKSYNPFKASGRSVSDYEKQLGLDKPIDTSKPAAANPKVDAPLPPSRPEYFTRGQAFSGSREKAGGGEGKFTYDNKDYQTNIKGEPYLPASKLKPVGTETESGKAKKIKEAVVAIRMASGKIEKHPPGKSGSSGGGD